MYAHHFFSDNEAASLHRARRRARWFGAIVLGMTAAISAAAGPPPAPLAVVSTVPHPVYDPVFVPQKEGFLGADGASSVLLGPGRLLWLFGDTIVGKQGNGKRLGPMIHNSVAIQEFAPGTSGTVSFHWATSGTQPLAVFAPKSQATTNTSSGPGAAWPRAAKPTFS